MIPGIIRCVIVAMGIPAAACTIQAQEVVRQLSTAADNYALGLRVLPSGYELWYTQSIDSRPGDDRRVMIARVHDGVIDPPIEAPAPMNQPYDFGPNYRYFDGVPTFDPCDPNRGIFVSNRPDARGGRHGNDLYEFESTGSAWRVTRIDALDASGWDDTPALADGGMTLYFSSDRRDPLDGTDLYMSRRAGGVWSSPVLLNGISMPGVHEQTPVVGPDGWLYYASNAGGSFDLWRVRRDGEGVPIASTRERLTVAGVNDASSDEFHPLFSPDGAWLFFSSNRGNGRRLDIYAKPFPLSPRPVQLRVLMHTRQWLGGDRRLPTDRTVAAAHVPVRIVDADDASVINDTSDANGEIELGQVAAGNGMLTGRRTHRYIVTAMVADSLVSSIDTLTVNLADTCRRTHELFIWERSILSDRRLDFAVQSVELFVKGYWCPTTSKYAAYTSCQSVFTDASCSQVPEALAALREPCADNALYDYRLIPAKMERLPRPGLCIRWSEVRDSADIWTERVDRVIDSLIDAMRLALQHPGIEESLVKNHPISVTVQGWTDPDPVDDRCQYTDAEFTLDGSVDINGADRARWIANGSVRSGTPFRLSPPDGNPMLSALRAYFMGVLLDNLWREQIPAYDNLRRRGLIKVIADGKWISQRHLAKQLQRSIDIIVEPIQIDGEPGPAMGQPATAHDLRCASCP